MPKLDAEVKNDNTKDYTNDYGTPVPAEEVVENSYADGKDYFNNDGTPRPAEEPSENPYTEAEVYTNDLGTPRPAEDLSENPYTEAEVYTNDLGTPRPAEDLSENPYTEAEVYTNDLGTPRPAEDLSENPYTEAEVYTNDLGTPRPAEDLSENPYTETKLYTNDLGTPNPAAAETSNFNLFEDAAAPATFGAERDHEVMYDKPADNSFSLFRSEAKEEVKAKEAAKEEEPLIAGVTPIGEAQSPAFHRNRNDIAAEPQMEAAAPKAEVPKVEAPKVEVPKVEVPKVEAPKAEAPKVEAPKVAAPKVEVPKVEAPQRNLREELELRNELMSSFEAGKKKKSIWNRIFSRPSKYDAVEAAMQDYLEEADPKKREKAAHKLYESCRDYLDRHIDTFTAGNTQFQRIKGQDKDRVRKQAVVHMLRIMESGKLPEFSKSSKQVVNAKPGSRKKLNFRDIEASLSVGSKSGEAYKELKTAMKAQKEKAKRKEAKKGHGMG